jgi:ABC-2 type transport system permease protein
VTDDPGAAPTALPERSHAEEGRPDPLLPNAWLIAKREFRERVRTRLFGASTMLLALLAVGIALTPIIVRAADRGSTTRIAVVTSEDHLANEILGIMGGALNASAAGSGQSTPYTLVRAGSPDTITKAVSDGEYNGALIATRQPSGFISFQFISGESIGADRLQYIGVGAIAVAILDWADRSRGQLTGAQFQIPTVDVVNAIGSASGRAPVQASEFAARRIIGVVFVVLIFITLVIYGMWVAAGVVAEKTSRVMELLISAASPAQLVVGKVVGIGLAGFVQYLAILVPAIVTIILEDRIADAVLGSGSLTGISLAVLSPGLLIAYGAFWILGFILYSLIYAAAGSLVSRAEDLQVLALPLSLIAIVGYLMAVMALSGGISGFMKVASFVPFWSPFIMLTRLTIGRADAWEVALAFGLLVGAIAVVGVLAVRVYSAGVLLYGQRPGLRTIAAAVLRPQG